MPLEGTSLILVDILLVTGIGPVGKTCTCLGNLRKPFFLLGGRFSPQELGSTSWLSQVHGEVLAQPPARPGGRLLD